MDDELAPVGVSEQDRMGLPVGTVAALWRFPVKSMLGEQLATAMVGTGGLVGDRGYALIDEETDKVVSVKRPRRWRGIFELTATTGPGGVHVTFPDGTSLPAEDPELAERLSTLFGRRVRLSSTLPGNPTFDEAWVRELKNGAPPYGGMPSREEEGDELIDQTMSPDVPGSFFNHGAVHIITTSTVRRLSQLRPDSRFDAHRFRPNIVVDTDEEGFVETAWQGRRLRIGEVELAATFTVPRCVMTTLAQGDLPADRNVLRTITQHNMHNNGATKYPCAGIYATVTTPGRISHGEQVNLTVV